MAMLGNRRELFTAFRRQWGVAFPPSETTMFTLTYSNCSMWAVPKPFFCLLQLVLISNQSILLIAPMSTTHISNNLFWLESCLLSTGVFLPISGVFQHSSPFLIIETRCWYINPMINIDNSPQNPPRYFSVKEVITALAASSTCQSNFA